MPVHQLSESLTKETIDGRQQRIELKTNTRIMLNC